MQLIKLHFNKVCKDKMKRKQNSAISFYLFALSVKFYSSVMLFNPKICDYAPK